MSDNNEVAKGLLWFFAGATMGASLAILYAPASGKATRRLIKTGKIEYELRTTCIPGYCELEDFYEIFSKIGNVKKYYLQQFRNEVTLDTSFSSFQPLNFNQISSLRNFIMKYSDICEIRGF